jgi:hypothetical protein
MSGENAPILPDKHGGMSEVEIIGDEDVERHGGGENKLSTVFSHLKPNQMPHVRVLLARHLLFFILSR